MTREEILQQVWDDLPLPSERKNERYCTPRALEDGLIYYLTFKKQRINGIVVGWELETIE